MKTEDIQKHIDAINIAMVNRGLRQADVSVTIRAHREPSVYVCWLDEGVNEQKYQFFYTENVEQALSDANQWVMNLPTREEIQLRAFMSAVGKAIEVGRAHNIDIDFLNPLAETMKRLSSNIITHIETRTEEPE